jgi:hypothetical protein
MNFVSISVTALYYSCFAFLLYTDRYLLACVWLLSFKLLRESTKKNVELANKENNEMMQ